MKEKVVLAYSGGLDTTAIIPWLKENYDYDVICCCIDCGQEDELDGLEERAKLSGASKLYVEDIVDEFCDDYILPCVQAGAVYENKYLLGTSMARPGIAKRLVEVARKEGATAICHGATGKGNDQIRFELGIKALAPDLKIIAAWRDEKWTMDSRESEIAFGTVRRRPPLWDAGRSLRNGPAPIFLPHDLSCSPFRSPPPRHSISDSRYTAIPSSSLLPITRSAASFTTSKAFPMAIPLPHSRSIPISA